MHEHISIHTCTHIQMYNTHTYMHMTYINNLCITHVQTCTHLHNISIHIYGHTLWIHTCIHRHSYPKAQMCTHIHITDFSHWLNLMAFNSLDYCLQIADRQSQKHHGEVTGRNWRGSCRSTSTHHPYLLQFCCLPDRHWMSWGPVQCSHCPSNALLRAWKPSQAFHTMKGI